ncbi:MAG TPA: response regulator [Tepidisphaeraceae bacterium]|jgi:two-component system chemotaxis response regulator CheY
MRAIVIDDSRAMRGILKRTLLEMGYDVTEAVDGCDALTKLVDNPPPALALVDWNMPNMNGLEFIKAIRQNAAFAGMQIMMVTTEVEMSQIACALEAGANEYLMKPFTGDVLREKLSLMNIDRAAA